MDDDLKHTQKVAMFASAITGPMDAPQLPYTYYMVLAQSGQGAVLDHRLQHTKTLLFHDQALARTAIDL